MQELLTDDGWREEEPDEWGKDPPLFIHEINQSAM